MDLLVKIFYALPVYQSVALSLLLFINGQQVRSHSRIIMGIFQAICTLYFAFNFLYALRSFEILVNLYFLVLPVILLFLPIFYLYLLSVTTPGFRFKRRLLLHFLPALLILLANLPFLFFGKADRLEYITHGFDSSGNTPVVQYLAIVYMTGIFGVLTLQLLLYFYKAVKIYIKHREYIQNHYSFTENISLNWIVALMTCLVIFFISNQMLYLFGYNQSYFSPLFYNVVMLGITLFVGYYALIQKDLKPSDSIRNNPAEEGKFISNTLSADQKVAGEEMENHTMTGGHPLVLMKEDSNSRPETHSSGKYAGSALSEARKTQLVNSLENLIRKEKIYENDSLSVEDVAIRLGTNSKYISQVINEQYGRNFYNYINAYRVEEAQKLLLSGGMEKYTILGIAQMVGFGSKSSFNSSFKKITGQTPSEFVKSGT